VMKLNGTEFEILTNLRDKRFIAKNLKELENEIMMLKGKPVKLRASEETLSTLGGAVVRTKDKRQIFNNTLEARMTEVKQEAGSKILDILFEGAED
jgi:vacuolar-type H+-ATPase subunit E/Vma4